MTRHAKKLANAPEDKKFWVCDGRVLKNLNDLENALRTMNDGTYKYHVNGKKNDFYNWIKNVFNNSKLADEIRNSRNQLSAANKLKREIGF
jgi:two-component SAPR family response regulator